MGSFGVIHWVLLIAVVVLLFGGRGKISDLMGDIAKGVKSFKKGMADEDDDKPRVLPPESRNDRDNTPVR